jgi:hypothetical protein
MTDEDVDGENQVNIDDLYEKKHNQSLRQLAIFNTILQRVNKQIKQTARGSSTLNYVWFIVPEYLFGQPLYKQAECISYIVHKLETNGFKTRYVHPNALYVSWSHWVPYYVRDEYKRKTGKSIDEYGNVIEKREGISGDENIWEKPGSNGGGNSSKTGGDNSANAASNQSTVRFANARAFQPPNMIYDESLMDTAMNFIDSRRST